MSNLFAFHEIIGDGATEIAADADPSSSAPPEARVVELGAIPDHAANGFAVFALDGTTITAKPWLYIPRGTVWMPLRSAGVVATPAAPAVNYTAGLALARGARVFMQLTTNTGVTRVAWRYG